MKKLHQILLLAALLLMPQAAMHADEFQLPPSLQRTIQQLPDSLKYDAFMRALEIADDKYDADYEQTKGMIQTLGVPIAMVVIFIMVLIVLEMILKVVRRRDKERNEIIHKMIDNGVFTSVNADAAEMLKALTPQKKSEKEHVIFSASTLGVGLGLIIFYLFNRNVIEFVPFVGCILAGYGLLSLVARAAYNDILRKKEKKASE